MILTTPVLPQILPSFDANVDYELEFHYYQGSQVYGSQVVIEDINNNIHYDKVVDSFLYKHIINANILTNGIEYKIKVRVYDVMGNYSQWSEYCFVKCLTTPSLYINNITDGKIYSQGYTFKAIYSQPENELLESYKFILYDKYKFIISNSGDIFNNNLEYKFDNLINGEVYYIECRCVTKNNISTTTGLIQFTPIYIKPRVRNILKLTNDSENACIHLDTRALQILGSSDKQSINYENDDWINVQDGMVYYDKSHGFNLNRDFTLNIWCNKLKSGSTFLTLYGDTNITLELVYENNKIHLYKKSNKDIISHYASDFIENYNDNSVLYIYVCTVNNRSDIMCEILK